MFPRPRRYTNKKITTTWSNKPLHIKLGISEADMNADLALQARVHDHEERDKEEETSQLEPKAKLRTGSDANIEEEKSVVDEGEKQSASGHDDSTTTTSERGDTAATGSSNAGEDNTIAARNETTEIKAAAIAAEECTGHAHGKQNQGGHTPGEAWTETPHFLWGP